MLFKHVFPSHAEHPLVAAAAPHQGRAKGLLHKEGQNGETGQSPLIACHVCHLTLHGLYKARGSGLEEERSLFQVLPQILYEKCNGRSSAISGCILSNALLAFVDDYAGNSSLCQGPMPKDPRTSYVEA